MRGCACDEDSKSQKAVGQDHINKVHGPKYGLNKRRLMPIDHWQDDPHHIAGAHAMGCARSPALGSAVSLLRTRLHTDVWLGPVRGRTMPVRMPLAWLQLCNVQLSVCYGFSYCYPLAGASGSSARPKRLQDRLDDVLLASEV